MEKIVKIHFHDGSYLKGILVEENSLKVVIKGLIDGKLFHIYHSQFDKMTEVVE